ncbi:hypothetical protein SLEP1_g24938 [Rubroshorea leprosula]|uniref:Uncharacterized protein n=1 Tax=Rubroshorea leprosula TaxID=152421 RepID=A0AAV5JHG8_9ROSI|nr:hypothetical protein SLEP1_g24938 [Rubroshorea leprosula]
MPKQLIKSPTSYSPPVSLPAVRMLLLQVPETGIFFSEDGKNIPAA